MFLLGEGILSSIVLFSWIQIANAVNEGQLVPEDVIFALLSKRLEEGYYRGESGFILDGIPRTKIQAVSLMFCRFIPFLFFFSRVCLFSGVLM